MELTRLFAATGRIGQALLDSLDLEVILDRLAEQIIEAGLFRSLMVAR